MKAFEFDTESCGMVSHHFIDIEKITYISIEDDEENDIHNLIINFDSGKGLFSSYKTKEERNNIYNNLIEKIKNKIRKRKNKR